MITLLYFILDDSSYVPKIAVFDINEDLVAELSQNADLTNLSQVPEDDSYLEDNNIDALFYTDTDGLKLLMLEQNSKSTAALKAITDAVASLQKNSLIRLRQAMSTRQILKTCWTPCLMSFWGLFPSSLYSSFRVCLLSGNASARPWSGC
ncbi:hypothetical protein Q5O14_00360 [Eubacteriaceae bacterium ES2]|nr:hypothetical protein Q5O14_00360 [Eubacteriaceae bacterium ES2]